MQGHIHSVYGSVDLNCKTLLSPNICLIIFVFMAEWETNQTWVLL